MKLIRSFWFFTTEFDLCDQHQFRSSYQRDHHYQNPRQCDPPCDVPHSECVGDYGLDQNHLICRCLPGFAPSYLPAPILSSRGPRLIFCQPTMTNGTLETGGPHSGAGMGNIMANSNDGLVVDNNSVIVPFKYYPGEEVLALTTSLSMLKKLPPILILSLNVIIYYYHLPFNIICFFRWFAIEPLDASHDRDRVRLHRLRRSVHLLDVVRPIFFLNRESIFLLIVCIELK